MDNTARFEKYANKIFEEFMYDVAYEKRKKALKICENAVDKFYDHYEPRSRYKRRGSLYEAYHIEIKNGEFVFELGHEFMTKKHRVDNEYIYEYMFKWGWHGGANGGEGHPDANLPKDSRRLYWRTPTEDRIEADGSVTKRYSLWYDKDTPAKQMYPYDGSMAPYQTIKREWNKFVRDDLRKLEMNTLRNTLAKYLKK